MNKWNLCLKFKLRKFKIKIVLIQQVKFKTNKTHNINILKYKNNYLNKFNYNFNLKIPRALTNQVNRQFQMIFQTLIFLIIINLKNQFLFMRTSNQIHQENYNFH